MIARTTMIRLAYLLTALAWWLLTLCGRVRRRPVTLCYHGVARRHRRRFARHAAILAGRDDVTVTFDDAFANLIENALPALAAHRVRATIFVVTDNLGGPPRWAMAPDHPDADEPTMTAFDLRRLARHPFVRFGSHTARHRALPELEPHQAWDELTRSRAALEAVIETTVDELAFPYGACDRATIDLAARCGYRHLHTLGAMAEPAPYGAEIVPRLAIRADAWAIELRLAADGAYAWLAGFRRSVGSLWPAAPVAALSVPAPSIAGRVGPSPSVPGEREREVA